MEDPFKSNDNLLPHQIPQGEGEVYRGMAERRQPKWVIFAFVLFFIIPSLVMTSVLIYEIVNSEKDGLGEKVVLLGLMGLLAASIIAALILANKNRK